MRIFVIGAGQVGSTIVEALHDEHSVTVFDIDPARVTALSYRYDVVTVEGNGASRAPSTTPVSRTRTSSSRARRRTSRTSSPRCSSDKLAPNAQTIVRTSNVEYLELWRERQLDVDFVVSSELEAAHAVTRTIGVPAARQTDVFAEGQVQIVEFDVEEGASRDVVDSPLKDAKIPPDSKVASIIRDGGLILPRGVESIRVGDRIVVIGSPAAARAWSSLMTPGGGRSVEDVVIYGAGRAGLATARMLLGQGIGVRLVEPSAGRARLVAEELPNARVYEATGLDPRLPRARAHRRGRGGGIRDA